MSIINKIPNTILYLAAGIGIGVIAKPAYNQVKKMVAVRFDKEKKQTVIEPVNN
jgi:hypothetical protein